MLRVPVDGRVLGEHFLAELARRHVPTRFAPVDEDGSATPAVRQRVVVVEPADQDATSFEFVVDDVVRGAHVLTFEPRDLGGERAVRSDGIDRGQTMIARHLAVDLAEGRRLMNESGAFFDRDVLRQHDVTGVDTFG